ncbi:FliI/YscN family ATPase [bacterium]|nr:FliI/YscN family ATPase [candidate division CSSED10-310 bacterium]
MSNLAKYLVALGERVKDQPGFEIVGYVDEISGVLITSGIRHVKIGEICRIETPGISIDAEVIGFRNEKCLLMPYASVNGLKPEARVIPTGSFLRFRCGSHLLGSVLNGLGQLIVPGPRCKGLEPEGELIDVHRPAPDPLKRRRIRTIMQTGIRSIDTFLTIGKGQRLGVFAGAGTGKSTLMGHIARSSVADVIVINLVGERGREVLEFIEDCLGTDGLTRSVVVVASSDQPAIVHLKSAYVATALAEYFRDQGLDVCLMMDSVTRFARALREIGLARGEPPARAGYPPSVYAELPQLMERTGSNERGTITAFYTVLVEGDDLSDPVADEVLSILDGHIILSRNLAYENRYPAIDLLKSKSRLMNHIVSQDHRETIARLLSALALYNANQDAIRFGFYESGKNQELDEAIRVKSCLDGFLYNHSAAFESLEEMLLCLRSTIGRER